MPDQPFPPGDPFRFPPSDPNAPQQAGVPSQAIARLLQASKQYAPGMRAQAPDPAKQASCDAEAKEVSGGDPVLYKRYFDQCMKRGS